jgi:hypothetical protein
MALIEIDGLPFLKMGGFSMATLNNQRVSFFLVGVPLKKNGSKNRMSFGDSMAPPFNHQWL